MRPAPGPLVLLLLVSPPWGAQEQPRRPELQIPVSTELVRIDVVVTDKGGRAKQGLAQADFVVLEDGQPQPITQFQAFGMQAAASVQAGPQAEPAPALEPPEESDADRRRHVVLAVDDVHIDAANLVRLRKTLDRFLERDAPPEDVIALVTTSGTRSLDFTTNRSALRQAVAQLTVQDRRPRQIDVPFIDEYQAERIMLGDPEALRVAVEEIRVRRASPNMVEEARSVARQVLAEATGNARITLETLDNVVRGMARLRGRKAVILVSDGFLTALQSQGGAGFDIRRITDAGARAGVIVYGLDSRGLQASAPGQIASSQRPAMAATFGPREQMARQSELAIHNAMNALAADTGGFLVAFTNNLSGGLQKILRDTEAYYLLAYEPTSRRRDGAFRKIQVRLPGQRDVRIRHRTGYLAPDDRKPALVAPAGVAAPAPPAEPPTGGAIWDALGAADSKDGLPVRVSADFVSIDAGVSQVVVSGHVDLRGVPSAQAGDRRVLTVDVGGAVYDEAGAEVARLPVERAAVDAADEAHARVLEAGLLYQRAAAVKPGRYRVGLAAREDGSQKVGSASAWVLVPDLASGTLALSSLFLMREDVPAAGTPSAAALRGVQARPVYGRSESLHVQFFAYNVGGGMVSRTEIWKGGQLLAVSRPEPLQAPAPEASRDVRTRKIGLWPFEPGDYEVRVVVRDERKNAEASQRAAFTIE